MICEDTHSAISSPEWGFGRTPSDVPGGATSGQFGQALAPANLSHRQAKALGLETSGIYGLRSSTSSRSAALRQFAENRLRAKTDTLGSTLYKLTWKEWPTPSGRSFCLLRASAARTNATGFGGSGWPTARASDGEKAVRSLEGSLAETERKGSPQDLCAGAHLASWPTPHVGTPQSMRGTGQDPERRREQGRQVGLQDAVRWAGWPTTTARDSESTARHTTTATASKPGTTLLDAARTAGWPTPKTKTGGPNSNREARGAGGADLQEAAQWAGWPTPQANDSEKRGSPSRPEGSQSCLPTAVPALAAWVTPSARDWKDTPGMATERSDGKPRTDQLPRQAYMSGWPTPNVDSFRSRSGDRKDEMGIQQLAQSTERWEGGPARLTAFGELRIGYSARMESGGQLNPEHARWLMGCPSAWGRSAPGWSDYAVWQELTEIALSEPSNIA